MNLKILKCNLPRGGLMRRFVLRAFMLMLALIVVSMMRMAREVEVMEATLPESDKCPIDLDSNPEFNLTRHLNSASASASASSNWGFPIFRAHKAFKQNENLTRAIFKELIGKNLLQSNARALCVGERFDSAMLALRHLGFFDVVGTANSHPSFSLTKGRFVYELNLEDNHFDFVFVKDLDRVSLPSLFVREIERILRPGATGAVLGSARHFYNTGGLVRPAWSDSSSILTFFKSSAVHLCNLGAFELVIFKKRHEAIVSFEHLKLPSVCPAIDNNKPLMKYIEPLTNRSSRKSMPEVSYLPKFMNISSRNKLVYISLGAGEYAKTSIMKMSKAGYRSNIAASEVYIIDHKTSVLLSFVTDPGINFIYHPALSGETTVPNVTSDEFFSAPTDEEGFEFVPWFDETVSDGDFVVLMMNAKMVELKILVEIFKSGAICRLDEVFLRCPDGAGTMYGDCDNLVKSLRKSGVYVHKWLGIK